MADLGNWFLAISSGAFGFGAGWAGGRADALSEKKKETVEIELFPNEGKPHPFEKMSGDALLTHTYLEHFTVWNQYAESSKLGTEHKKAHGLKGR